MTRGTLSARRFASGLSLVELMVSIAIGLVVTVAVFSSYLGSTGATRMAEAQVRMNEDGQAALTVLALQLRMAGNNPKQPEYANGTPRNPITSTFIVRGCDGTFSNIATAERFDDLTCTGGGSPDSVAIRYEADLFNTVPVNGRATDCLGQALPILTGTVNKSVPSVPTDVTYTVADNRFYLGTSSAVLTPGLYCKGNGHADAQRLVENVVDLQFQYGTMPTASADQRVAGYLSADGVAALGLATGADNWAKTLTVRVCVLIRSEQPVAPDVASAGYTDCSGADIAGADRYLRRAYSTTVLMRNRLLPS